MIAGAISDIEAVSCVKFRFVEYDDPDLVLFYGAIRRGGCQSPVGYTAGKGVHAVHLERPGCSFVSIVQL